MFSISLRRSFDIMTPFGRSTSQGDNSMKKIVASFAAFFLLFSMPSLFAQMPLGVPVVAGISQDIARIGVVAAAGGRVELTTPGQVGRVAQSGQPVFMGDLVTTDEKGHLQILLLDETVFTIGPNSAITIDKFVYDPKTQGGEIKASVTKAIRYIFIDRSHNRRLGSNRREKGKVMQVHTVNASKNFGASPTKGLA
jgi:hypothetical protein